MNTRLSDKQQNTDRIYNELETRFKNAIQQGEAGEAARILNNFQSCVSITQSMESLVDCITLDDLSMLYI